MNAHSPTLDRIDFEAITPDRLVGVVEYDIFDQLVDFEHRGCRCKVDRLLSYLGAAIENRAVVNGETSEPGSMSELEAVNVATAALSGRFPTWFGDPDELADLNMATSDRHLSEADIREDYWQDEFVGTEIDTTDWTSIKQVIVPLTAIALEGVDAQKVADEQFGTDSAQEAIRRTVMKEAFQHSLSDDEIDEAVQDAKRTLQNQHGR
ncbi:hypothetical protein [Halorubrum laminariae]|uniref:Uncharacterized protein n=1 Tax=Halorubrum laminariae TaxID=1433523 RepID=A0ABD6C027_9EURY|nr:hypothetical protein [Halorubrum laminariae]